MKNKLYILGLILSLVSISVSATPLTAQLDSTKLNKELLYKDAKDVVKYLTGTADSVVSKSVVVLANTSNHVWDILVRQQLVKSIAILISILVYIGLIYFYKSQLVKTVERVKTEQDEWNKSEIWFAVLGGIVVLALAIFNISHFETMITGFINPRYGAMMEILNTGTHIIR